MGKFVFGFIGGLIVLLFVWYILAGIEQVTTPEEIRLAHARVTYLKTLPPSLQYVIANVRGQSIESALKDPYVNWSGIS